MVVLLRVVGAGSLQPSPARSYQQTVVNFATSPWTTRQPYPPYPPPPDSRTTTGLPDPEQSMFKLWPPISTERPIRNRCLESCRRPISSYVKPSTAARRNAGASPLMTRLTHRLVDTLALPFHRKPNGVAAAETQRRDSLVQVAANHLVKQCGKDACSAGPDGVSQRHRAAVHVDFVEVES